MEDNDKKSCASVSPQDEINAYSPGSPSEPFTPSLMVSQMENGGNSSQLSVIKNEENSDTSTKKNRMLFLLSKIKKPKNPPAPSSTATTRKRRTSLLISADNRLKVTWDILTVAVSILSLCYTNRSIQNKSYERSFFDTFCEVWFLVDILLNFVTEHKTIRGEVIRDGRAVWARYLTSWFPIDALSLIPWERHFVKPIVDMQAKRGFFRKSFFRTSAVVRVSRKLRAGHFKLFGKVANQTKHIGVGSSKLLVRLIRYLPKYVMFYKNMKTVLAVRTLRQIHWIMKVVKGIWIGDKNMESTYDLESLFDEYPDQNFKRHISAPNEKIRLVKNKETSTKKDYLPYIERSESEISNGIY